MKNSRKKEIMLLYVLLCVLCAAVVISFWALPKFSKAQELEEETQAEQEYYDELYSDVNYAAALAADVEELEQKLAEKRGSYTGIMTSAQADQLISPKLSDNGFEITSLSISKLMTYEEAFPEGAKAKENSGVTVLKLTYEIIGDWKNFSRALEEISQLDGCAIGEISCNTETENGLLTGKIYGKTEVCVFMY